MISLFSRSSKEVDDISRSTKKHRLELLSALSGVLIAGQSRINGELSSEMGDSLEAALVSFGSGLIFVSLISFIRKDVRAGFKNILRAVANKSLSQWRLGAGVLGASFVVIQTYVVPIVGVVLFSVASLAGQTVISLWVDHVGLIGNRKTVVTIRRLVVAFITVLSVIISAWDRFSLKNFSPVAIFLAVIAGGWVGVQRALNGQINSYSNTSFATSQLNFITGSMFLLLLLILRSLFSDHSIMNLSTGPWWMFLGGSIGVIYIAISAVAVQHLGVLDFTLFSVGGMLFGSLVIDVFAPTTGTFISWYLLAGILISYLGVIANGQTLLSRR